MFKLFKATTVVSFATMAYILVGIVRAKFTAVTLGPSGVGIFSQALSFQQLVITIASLSIGLGITKYISKYNAGDNASAVKNIVSCAVFMQILVSFISILFVMVSSGVLSRFLFSKHDYGVYLSVLSFGVPFLVLAGTGESILFGFGNYGAFAKARSLSYIFSLIPLFIFVHSFHIKGGFIYMAVNGLLTFFVYRHLLYKNVPKGLLNGIFSITTIRSIGYSLKQYSRPLLSYGGASFVTGILNLINIVFLRSLVIRFFGTEANGYYQVVFALSAYYLAFFTNGLWSYLYPKIAALEDRRRYSVELNHAMRFCIFGVVPFMAAIFVCRNFIINLLFSSKFVYSSGLFATQLFGDLFFVLLYITGTSLLANTRLKWYLIFGVLYSVNFIGLFLLLSKTLTLKAITVSYLISNAALFSAALYYHIKAMNIIFYKRNVLLLLSAVAVSIVILFIGKDTLSVSVLKMALLVSWLAILSKRSEKKKLFCIIANRIKTIYGQTA